MAASPRAPVAATLFAVVAFLMTRCAVAEPPPSERSALLAFLTATRQHERRSLGWDASAPTCGWAGVTCDAANSTVVAVRLPGVGIAGAIPRGTLGRLANLRVLSLRANRVVGTIPGDLLRLPRLRALYLQQNLLSGATILTRIARLGGGLERLVLSRNNLSGHIPSALGNLTALQVVRLDGNRLSGSIPSMILAGLAVFNVSNNDLSGSIPKSFARFPPDSFAGNRHLCGDPLPPCGGSRL
ncbi:putative inactive receptor kinase [Dichanthelium oligosanthes]|uniref:Putative inactive receptor kinase n=1 Tax=Dichanthelium oligosanthes TaxID=888268 RepID=A0A1E5UPD5_9POAL|nr:putative inactive receptor kinase [Dichanthelium oligosanthes]